MSELDPRVQKAINDFHRKWDTARDEVFNWSWVQILELCNDAVPVAVKLLVFFMLNSGPFVAQGPSGRDLLLMWFRQSGQFTDDELTTVQNRLNGELQRMHAAVENKMDEDRVDPLNAPMNRTVGHESVIEGTLISEGSLRRLEDRIREEAQKNIEKARVRQENAHVIAVNQLQKKAEAPKPFDWKKKYLSLRKYMRLQKLLEVNRIDAVQNKNASMKRSAWQHAKLLRYKRTRPVVMLKGKRRPHRGYRRSYRNYKKKFYSRY